MSHVKLEDTQIDTLGPAKLKSTLMERASHPQEGFKFVGDEERVLLDPTTRNHVDGPVPSFERAGPRERVYFDPTKLKAAVVTCGGMCPGINHLTRSIVLQLYWIYGVKNIVGVRYGLQGFIPDFGHELIELTPDTVRDVHGRGGSFLGMSRGPQPIEDVVDALERLNISMLFMIGGDGTLRAAQAIYQEITARNLKVAVVAIPKTIDNDISFVEMTFGFQTAVEAATKAIEGAHNEALGSPGGIGLVKLMGRNSGFVAANATLGLSDVNFCLIPEVDFDLEGPNGLLQQLEHRLGGRGHAVIVVAEGAGQKFFSDTELGRDASGNLRLGDIGVLLKNRINTHFKEKGREVNLKYIDPSYLIRSVAANCGDRIYTGFLGHYAVHAGISGRTGLMISKWNNFFVHVPIAMAINRKSYVDPKGSLWRSVREATGQAPLVNEV
ncbi:MAG: ATP-dependent 6-phosphofructokinase [Deltaproteobacteria bacterium]|nr:ATP-dependent 6-phosphofructokinase [Deltaproteobacteria bacterium]MCB2186334.1 ATP-dependent 6-phosphofructokinase [Deltaproteobacteria bacterium]